VICKIAIADLVVGMYIVDSGLSWMEHPYLFSQEGSVESEQTLETIRNAGYLEVFVDTERGLAPADAGPSPVEADKSPEPASKATTPLAEELLVAEVVHHDCLLIARDILRAIQSGGEIDIQACSTMVDSVVGSVTRNPDALITLCKLRRHDAYTFTHGVNVSVLAAAFGAYLGLPTGELQELGLAGLFHDVGKAVIPDAILNKPGRLTPQEFDQMKEHPALGRKLLAGLNLPEAVLRGVCEHHERFDGSGYPGKLSGAGIHTWGRILAVADVYDALTSRRSYKDAMLATRALAVIHGMRGRDFPTALAERFIKFLGPYPVGSFVRLTNGEHGFVRGSNPKSPLRPEILVAFDAQMRPLAARHSRDLAAEADFGLGVAAALDPTAHGLDPLDYLMAKRN
jgi:HD-GYP domain-containing protein (c-di-GMP phosphodiesterase class II)